MNLLRDAGFGELEGEYRQSNLAADIRHIAAGIYIWQVAVIGFALTDLLIVRATWAVSLLFVLRVAFVLLSLIVVRIIKTRVTDYRVFDRLVLLWVAGAVLAVIMINLTRPRSDISFFLVDLVIVFSFYVFVPHRPLVRAVPALLFTIFDLVNAAFYRSATSPTLLFAVIFTLVITNLVGILFSARIDQARRMEFRARRHDEQSRAELERMALTDPLTGVFNRRRLLEIAGEAFYRFRRYRRIFSVILIDLDGFKTVNDTFGHQQGDQVLVQFAEVLNSEKRHSDGLGRMGGDEFCLVLPETDTQAALVVAERILQRCRQLDINNHGLDVRVTASIGISQVQADDESLDPVFARADAVLYQAKNRGRDSVEVYR